MAKAESHEAKRVPRWFWVAAAAGFAWNAFGVVQFIQSQMATKEHLMSMGMTDTQAQLMTGYPMWMTAAFAIGTFGGLIGCVLLLLQKKMATQVFAVSLIGYIILYIGDITEGVFAALGSSQVVILTMVVLIAALLLWFSLNFEKRQSLR